MKIIAIHIWRWQEEEPVLLGSEYELSALWFYQRNTAKEHVLFNSRTIVR